MRNRIGEAGRQIKTRHLEVIQGKSNGRASVAFLDSTKNELVHRWLNKGQSTREISRGLRINDREAVERAVQEALAPRPRPFLMRRAA